jgi:hypothetical protein
VTPFTWSTNNPSKFCTLTSTKTVLFDFLPDFSKSIFRHIEKGVGDTAFNRMAEMANDFSGRDWDNILFDYSSDTTDVEIGGEHVIRPNFRLALISGGGADQLWWEGNRVLLATMTFMVEDEMTICIDTVFWPPNTWVHYTRMDAKQFIPRLDSPPDSSWCFNISFAGPKVNLTPGPDQNGRATTDVSVKFYIENLHGLAETFDVSVTDSLGWSIDPLSYEVPLDSGEVDSVSFVVSIPLVPIGTTDRIFVTAVSQSEPTYPDSASLTVTCNALPEEVDVTAGSDQGGYPDSIVSIAFLIQNVGVVSDSYSLDISDTEDWDIAPLHYDIDLDTAGSQPVSFTVSIPYVPLGTIDQIMLLAVSKTNPLARDSAFLNVTCNAFVEGWDIIEGNDISDASNSLVTAVFYIENTGIAPDSCHLTISDSLGWDIQPADYWLTLNPGEQDSVFFDIQIPSVPVGTIDKVTLSGASLTNPFAVDTADLFITCDSYNITITAISDIGNDEGKQVKVEWSSFPANDDLVTHFTLFRREDPLLYASPVALSKLFSAKDYPPGDWFNVGTYQAYGETLYLAVAPTLKDSTISEGMHWSVFFIRAGTDNPTVYFDSPVDSGYSLDNLLPSPPTSLFASHEPAVTKLTWNATSASDFDYYTLYRDTLSGFSPDLNNRLDFTIDTTFTDSDAQLGRTYYYLACATDFSGNQSDPSNEASGVRYITGDANANGDIEVGDVVRLITYLFRNGSPPTPLEAGDVTCDGEVTVDDVVYLIRYLFRNGPPPCEP